VSSLATTINKAGTSTKETGTTNKSDAVTLLKADHRSVEKLFDSFEKAGDRAHKSKRKLVDSMITELSIHAFIEEQVLYPAARQEIASARDDVLEALEEHHVVKWQLQELIGLDPTDERFVAKVTVLTENVRHHVKEEESELFPLLRKELGRARLVELGVELQKAKGVAPHHPHPRVPADPVYLIPDAVTSVIDRAKKAVKSVRST
jgi:hemerythrin-like domain-containing protein